MLNNFLLNTPENSCLHIKPEGATKRSRVLLGFFVVSQGLIRIESHWLEKRALDPLVGLAANPTGMARFKLNN